MEESLLTPLHTYGAGLPNSYEKKGFMHAKVAADRIFSVCVRDFPVLRLIDPIVVPAFGVFSLGMKRNHAR